MVWANGTVSVWVIINSIFIFIFIHLHGSFFFGFGFWHTFVLLGICQLGISSFHICHQFDMFSSREHWECHISVALKVLMNQLVGICDFVLLLFVNHSVFCSPQRWLLHRPIIFLCIGVFFFRFVLWCTSEKNIHSHECKAK